MHPTPTSGRLFIAPQTPGYRFAHYDLPPDGPWTVLVSRDLDGEDVVTRVEIPDAGLTRDELVQLLAALGAD